jgi:hypothetical protein
VSEDLEEKKLLGSGGYDFAKLTEQVEIKASLGVPQIFLGNVGRLNEDRFSKYYCKRCEKEYHGSPVLSCESPNEELGEGISHIFYLQSRSLCSKFLLTYYGCSYQLS